MSDGAVRYPKRSAQAARTRATIIAAAGELFGELGYAGTTMKAIARRARVSVESVYLAGSKSALLATAMTVAFTGTESDRPLAEEPGYAAVFANEDVGEALDSYVDVVSVSIARSDPLWRTARAAADAEPEIRRLMDEALARRRSDLAMTGPWLVSRGVITPDLIESANATLSALVSHEVYEHLVDEFGWTLEQYVEWLRTVIRRVILDQPGDVVERSES
ncbi:TetR/AcrR family transcriptional regulator [Compostimonas suwonensis]|uniref:Regulatory TetR family protein n=1 Tax=Compostimonas suwonensis TaxID=1048394 RepID=A0A2M9BZC5_9MICO|nr:TetR/AcrR family transcriptional regulator [Compostimonas suwonensis]PJJ63432.1 regulatory TetR family protein [Compostimonas suwonensis]